MNFLAIIAQGGERDKEKLYIRNGHCYRAGRGGSDIGKLRGRTRRGERDRACTFRLRRGDVSPAVAWCRYFLAQPEYSIVQSSESRRPPAVVMVAKGQWDEDEGEGRMQARGNQLT